MKKINLLSLTKGSTLKLEGSGHTRGPSPELFHAGPHRAHSSRHLAQGASPCPAAGLAYRLPLPHRKHE